MMAVLVYSIAAFSRIYKAQKDRRVSAEERTSLTCFGLTILAQFFVEPIWQGSPLLFCAFVMVDGMIAKFLVSGRKSQR